MPSKITQERYDLLLEAAQKAETAQRFNYTDFDDALEFRLVEMQKQGLKNFAADAEYTQLYTAYDYTKNILIQRRNATYPAVNGAIDEAMLAHAETLAPGNFAKATRLADECGDKTFYNLENLRRKF